MQNGIMVRKGWLRWIAAGVLVISLMIGYYHLHAAVAKKTVTPPPLFDEKRFRLDHVQRRDLKRWGVIPGVVHAFRKAKIYAHVPGYLKFLNVDKGDPVHRGQVLAYIFDP